MSTQLIDNIVDEAAITKQLTNLDSQLLKTVDTLSKCAVTAKNFSDQFTNAKGINEIELVLKQYNDSVLITQKEQESAAKKEQLRADALLKLQKVQESNAKTELLNAQAIAVTQKTQESAAKAEQTRTESSVKQAAQAAKAAQAEKALSDAENALISVLKNAGISVDKLNVSKSQATAINKLVVTAATAEKGSHEQLVAQYELNYKAYNKLSAVQRDTTAGIAMQKNIEGQSKALKDVEGPLGNFNRQVGDYKNQILSATGASDGFLGKLANIAMGAEKGGDSLSKVGVTGIKAFGKALWELMANPVVAVIAGIAAVLLMMKAAIDSNGEATNKLKQVMAPFKEIMAILLHIFSEFVSILLTGVLELEKWANAIMSVIPGLDKIAEKNNQAIELEKKKQELAGKSRQLMVDEAKTHEQTTELMTKARQKDRYSIEQRLGYMKQADNAELELSNRKVDHAKEAFQLIKDQMELEGKSYKELTSDKKDEYKKAEAEIYSVREEYFAKTRRLHTQEASLILESQKDYIDAMKLRGNAEIEAWKASQNTSNMNSTQKIAYEKEYANKVIDLQQKANKQRIEDQIKNDAIGLSELKKSIAERIKVQNEAWINEANTKEEYDRRTAVTLAVISSQQAAEEKKSKEGTDKKVKLINDENSMLDSQRKEASQKAIAEYEAAQIVLLQKQNEAHLLKMKAESNYNDMTHEQKMAFDKKYFEEEQKFQNKIIDLTKSTPKIKKAEREKLEAQAEIFRQEQHQKEIQYLENEIGIKTSYSNSQIKVDQDYGNKSLAYQQHITKLLFEVQAEADEKLARMKLENKQITEIELQTVLNNIKAARNALNETHRTQTNSDDNSKSHDAELEAMNKALVEKHKLYSEGKISAAEYENAINAIKENSADKQLQVDIESDKKEITFLKSKGEDTLKLEQDLIAKEESLDAKKAAKKIQAEKALQAKIVDLIKTSAAAIQSIGDDQFQAQLDKISALKTANSDASEKEKDEITKKYESGILSKKEADAQSKVIDDQKAARDKQLEQQEKEIKIRQAKFDKLAAEFNIGIQLIETVAKIKMEASILAMNPLTIPLVPMALAQIPIAIGISAVQLAAVLAKPLPAYALGTDDHSGGPALLGDAYKHEMLLTPDGSIEKSPNVPTVMDLPKHTKVFPDFDKALQSMAFDASIRSMYDSIPSIEINAYNDALMRKTMGTLVRQNERQTGELGRLKDIGKHMENMVSSNLKIVDAIKSNKKNPWVN